MKVLILYRPQSEHATAVQSFVHDFSQRHDVSTLRVVDVDSREGIDLTTLYGVMSYPTILALRDDGSVLRSWEGDMLPLMDEVAFYTTSIG